MTLESQHSTGPWAWLAGVVSLVLAGSAWAEAPPKRLLLLLPYGANFSPWYSTTADFRAALSEASPTPVETVDVSVDPGRNAPETVERAIVDYIAARFADRPPDLIVPIGRPAAVFAAKHRPELFPDTPLLTVGTAAQGGTAPKGVALGPNDGVVALDGDVVPLFANGVGFKPRETLIVIGATNYERAWLETTRRVAQVVGSPFTDTFGMSMPDIKARVKSLAPDSLVLFSAFAWDGAGVPWEFDRGLSEVLSVSPAPVIAATATSLGSGVLATAGVAPRSVGRAAGAEAAAILQGAKPRVVPALKPDPLTFDERAVRRLGPPGWTLPVGARLEFREPSLWDRVRPYALAGGLLIVAQTALIVLLTVNRRRRREAEQDARRLAQGLLHAQDEERARIAREVHDNLAQRVSMLGMRVGLPSFDCAGRPQLQEDLAQLLKELSATAYRLHPGMIDHVGLVPALEAEAIQVTQSVGMRVEVELSDVERTLALPPSVALCVYRVVQESLRNASRHGKAGRARVHLAVRDGGLQFAVHDDGAGFDSRQRHQEGLGLMGMRERVRELGGEVDVSSTPGEGTDVIAWVPLPTDAALKATS